ncbi:MAG: DEAD/DEAH box helicase [Patescibacteria group bacterium]
MYNKHSSGAGHSGSNRSFSHNKPAGHSSRPGSHSARPASSGGYQGHNPRSAASRFGGSHGHSGSRGPSRFGGNRGGGNRGGGSRGGRGGGFSKYIDISKFVNKAVITETVDNFVPDHAFVDFHIEARLKANIVTKGYITPTPIQDKAIPHVLRNVDLVGIANTGTGKTAAFLIPLINKILLNPKEKILVVVPTRELAQQIEEELKGFTKNLPIWSVCCVGGASIVPQLKGLSRQNQFVIGTPGRLRDLIERGRIRLAEYNTVVLDEADRMLDMGFITDIKFMIAGMPKVRQTLFFSATMSKEIEALIGQFLTDPVKISVKTADTAASVDQDIIRVPPGANKLDILVDHLNQPGFTKVIIFGKTKHGVQRLAEDLVKRKIMSEAIHGNKSQGQRMRALRAFKEHSVKVLVATDVAARGLDISGVTHVINFDIPATYEDYVHRIGRTGRAGKKGKALTFV